MENSPYDPPSMPTQWTAANQPQTTRMPGDTPGPPRVWSWYVGYCACMALLYLLSLIAGVFLLANSTWLAEETEEEPLLYILQGSMFTVLGSALLVLYAAAPFLPRRKWAWYYGFVTIGIGMTSLCCVPFTIPLLIFWIKEDTKRYLGAEVDAR